MDLLYLTRADMKQREQLIVTEFRSKEEIYPVVSLIITAQNLIIDIVTAMTSSQFPFGEVPENIISSIKKHPRAPAGARGCFLIDEMMFSGNFIEKNLVF